MSPKQNVCYWAEWRACAEALGKLGKPRDDAARKALHADALGGVAKSSKDLTNPEFTRVLARFRSYSKPGDLAAQMHAENEPEERRAATLAEIERLGDATGIQGGLDGVGRYFKKWLAGRDVERLDADKLRKLLFILRKRAKDMGAKVASAPAQTPTARKPAPVAEPADEWTVAEGVEF